MKKSVKIILIVCSVLIILCASGYFVWNYLENNKVDTVLTMDINPSIKVSLNKNKEVVKVEALNDDAKKILKDVDLKGYTINNCIKEISTILIKEKYLKPEEENSILINIEGNDIKEDIIKIIDSELKEKNITCNIIVQEINEEAKEKANKYNISESKSSYIETVIENNSELELNFEELKDISIEDINDLVQEKTAAKVQEEEQKRLEEQKKAEEEAKKLEEAKKKTETNTTKKTESSEPRYGSTAKCEKIVNFVSNDDAYRKTLDDLGLPYEKYGYTAQTIASIYNDICVYETLLIHNKVMYKYYHNYENNELVHKESSPFLAGELEPITEIINNYFATTYGATPDSVLIRSGSNGTFDDKNAKYTAEYNGGSYNFIIVKKTGVITSVTKQ